MKLNPNDKRLLSVLPALLVAAAYLFFCCRPLLQSTRGLEASLRALGSEEQLLAQRAQLASRQARLREQLAAGEAQKVEEVQAHAEPREDAAASLRHLQGLFQRNGLRLVSALVEERRETANQNRAQQALARSGVAQPKSWSVTVEAPYKAVIRLLDDCSTNRFPVIAETLSMRPGAGEGKPTYWTLTLCL